MHVLALRRRGGAPPPTGVTWNPATSSPSGLSFSVDNLTVTNVAGAYRAAMGSLARNSGKHYFEVLLSAHNTSPYAMIGLAGSLPPGAGYVGAGSDGYGYYQETGQKYNAGSPASYGAAFTSGDVIGVGYDASTGQIEFFKNGTSQGVAFTVSSGTSLFPCFSPYQAGGFGTLRASATDIGTLPAGYSAWE